MANGWTPERRARQSALIRNWQPWKHSTGPRTSEGKTVVAKNATKHGMRSTAWQAQRRALAAALMNFQDALNELRELP